MAIRRYEGCEFCSETPFTGFHWGYDQEKERYSRRLFVGLLQVTPEKMFADISTKNGVQVLWRHGGMWGEGGSIGRVESMEFAGKKLIGTVALSEDDIIQFVPGGLDVVEAGLTPGLSVGLQFLDNPPVTWKMGEGTREKPDRMTYEAVRIIELSVTPVPRIHTAGLGKRMGDDQDTGDEMEKDGDDEAE